MMDWIGPALAALSAVFAAILAYRGTKSTDSTDRLSKAAGLYSDYADKMENRLTVVEKDNKELKAGQAALEERVDESEKQAELYKKEAGDYKKLILEVIQWITELLDWELRDYAGPQPRVTLNMVLSHLTTFMKSRNFEDPDTKVRGESDAN